MTSVPAVGEEDLLALRALLRESGLPDDVGEHRETLVAVARDGDVVIGGVAVEIHSGHGLLRSLVVEEGFQARGVGSGLVAAAESAAASHGLDELYLLTETAEAFFESRSYAPVERSDVPEGVKGSSEFAELCPDTAVAMRKSLRH